MLIIQNFIEDFINRVTGKADDSIEPMDVGNPELTREDEITTVKKRPPKRENKAKERKSLFI